ncbi:hypothetical protein [Pararhizobium qamdonense]|uniref:hypothetical protein n=1 Tax=Pararhizobium qamdonense TaxID=3031126 RepID=UPI0023E23A97|nr:hypothetical protein [Pararhizobium qamdonense]
MPNPFTVEIAEVLECRVCKEVFPINVTDCPKCGEWHHRLTFEDFYAQLETMRIMDARLGGLVLGRPGPEDDIPMYAYATDGIFETWGLMQGGEYILSHEATKRHGPLLEEINSEKGAVSELKFPSTPITTINTNLMPLFSGLWIRGKQFIVNRFATAANLELLEKLNFEASPDAFKD